MQVDLTNLENWSLKWQLPFNSSKCKVMYIGKKNPMTPYKLYNKVLDSTESEKDLGVMMDNSMKFHTHTSFAVKKANQILGLIKKSFKTRDASTMTSLYKSFVRPYLEYGSVIWGPHFKEDQKKIEGVQRRATKIISGMHNLTYEERLEALNLPSLAFRRDTADMHTCYKIIKGIVRIDPKEIFTFAPSRATRGHDKRLLRTKATKLFRINSFSQRVIKNWNRLPQDTINSSSLNIFKNKLDNLWKEKKFKF